MGSDSEMPAARLGDIDTGHPPAPPTPIITGSTNVFINSRPAARRNDMLAPHHPGIRLITEGSKSVFINGQSAARVSDSINCGGKIITGSTNVLIGNSPRPVRNAQTEAELSEYIRESLKPGNIFLTPLEEIQLAADIAVKYRGPEGAIATWHDHYMSNDPEPGDLDDPLRAAGYQRALEEKAEDAHRLEALAKGQRWRGRQQQIAQAKAKTAGMPPGKERNQLAAAADRFAYNNMAVEKARLAADVYNPAGGPPTGWVNLSDNPEALQSIGLKTSHLKHSNSSFGAQVYVPDPAVFGNDMKTTISFKGTDFACKEDWENNVAQGLDRDSLYYRKAVSIGTAIEKKGADVEFAGHSLGGGLGSAAARASGKPAITYNAAGLHSNTVARYGGTPIIPDPDNIQAIRVKGEILTGVQEQSIGGTTLMGGAGALVGGLFGGPPGAAIGAGIGSSAKVGVAAGMPNAVGIPHTVPGKGFDPVARHGMEQVIAGIEAQKDEDQAVLNAHLN